MTRTEWIVENRETVLASAKRCGVTNDHAEDFFQYLCMKSLSAEKMYPDNRIKAMVMRYVRWRARKFVKVLESSARERASFVDSDMVSKERDGSVRVDVKDIVENLLKKERDRKVVMLRLGGFRYKDIGNMMNLTANNARKIVFRFRKILKNGDF